MAFDAELSKLARQWRATRPAAGQNLALPLEIGAAPDPDESDTRRYSFGLNALDRRAKLMRPGGFTVIGARQGQGKTALAEKIALDNAILHTVAFASLEMTPTDLRQRMLSEMMRVPEDNLAQLRLHGHPDYEAACERLRNRAIHVLHPQGRQSRSWPAIVAFAERVQCDLLIVDHTRIIDGWIPGTAGCGSIVRDISQWAKDTRTHVVLLSQLNRAAQSRRPSIAELQDTDKLGQEADKVVLIWRSGVGSKNDDVAELIVAKNRKGPEFKTHVRWYGPTTSFFDVESEAEEKQIARCCVRASGSEA